MKVLVTGKDGQLGKSIQDLVANTTQGGDFFFAGRRELDLGSESSIACYFDANSGFDVIVNCAAYTAVDQAEREPILADQINHLAVKKIAEIAKERQIKFIHISTDYVFDGKNSRPYREIDTTNPINTYGKTKLLGEKAILEIMPFNAIIIRVSWLYSKYGKNFVRTILNLASKASELNVVNDQVGSPTYATDLSRVILDIANCSNANSRRWKTQIYHYSNRGECSWCDFAKEIVVLSGVGSDVRPVLTEQYPTLAARPKYTAMDTRKIVNEFGAKIPHWKKSLGICIEHINRK